MTRRTLIVLAIVLCAAQSGAAGTAGRYVVQSGDTLSGIAAAQLGSARRWDEIAQANGLRKPYTIRSGQRLRLPARPTDQAQSADGGGALSSLVPTDAELWSLGMLKGNLLATGGVVVVAVGALLTVVGGLTFLVSAFRTGFWWGMGAIFVPPVWLVFLVRHWRRARAGFILEAVGGPLVWLGIILLGASGMVVPALS
jgi:murein DD-endopeptidase MepM/ murein hydrolase activator NlpD